MGTVLELRLPPSPPGDWTLAERNQLYDICDRLGAAPGREIVFGVTDNGDPWCVVLDDGGEVLLHVARIEGRFVVHSAPENALAEAGDLRTAISGLPFADTPTPRQSTVVSLHGEVLAPHILVALAAGEYQPTSIPLDPPPPASTAEPARFMTASVATAAPFLDQEPLLEAPENSRAAEAQDPPSPPELATAASVRDEITLVEADAPAAPAPVLVLPQVAEVELTTATSPASPAPETPPPEASRIDVAGGETLSGGAGADTLIGGDGDDLLDGRGAGEGEIDLLDGGAGDDQIVMGPQVVAIGGDGDDVFLVADASLDPSLLRALGIIVDFFESRDDRLEFTSGEHVRVVGMSPGSDVLASVRNIQGLENAPVIAGARLALDFNGDGQADGFILLGAARPPAGPRPAKGEAHPGAPGLDWLWRPNVPQIEPDALARVIANPNLVGLESGPFGPYGAGNVLTAGQIGPSLFGDYPEWSLPEPGMAGHLRLEDLAPAQPDPWT